MDRNNNILTTIHNHNNWEKDTEYNLGTKNIAFITPSDGLVNFSCYSIYNNGSTHSFNDRGMFTSITSNIRIVKNGDTTEYEPYKTNILSTSEDVELRGIGDVQDELDLLTGEVTERIGEIVLDGSENWGIHGYGYCLSISHLGMYHRTTSDGQVANNFVTDSVPTVSMQNLSTHTTDGIAPSHKQYKEILLFIKKVGESNLNGLKQWLSQNPITVQYELATKSIKTVDLTVVDQDGEPTKLKTFDGITHVEIGSDQIIPELDLEVATTIEETMTAISLNGDAIDIKQDELVVKVNEQMENIDETMMATTEIYEQTYKEDE